jgi:tetratricopeptide (TPR) repeat protein
MTSIAQKIIPVLVSFVVFFSSCSDNEEKSTYGDLLSQPPYDVLTDSIKKNPAKDELYFRRAILLNKNNLPEPSLADFQKAWSIRKDVNYALGISTLLLDSQPDSAITFLMHASKEIPGNVLLSLSLARAYDAQNRTDDALVVCDGILQKNPEQVDAIKMKSDMLEKKGDMPASISILEKAYRLTPFDVELNYNLAYKYAESKNPKTVTLCDSLIGKDSMRNHAEPYYYKGLYYSNIGDKMKAVALFEQAIQHDYYYLNAYIEKGRAYYDLKKYDDAIKALQLVNTVSATFPDGYFWLGKCQEALGEKDEAKLNYQRAYGLDKTFTEAKEAADRLH